MNADPELKKDSTRLYTACTRGSVTEPGQSL